MTSGRGVVRLGPARPHPERGSPVPETGTPSVSLRSRVEATLIARARTDAAFARQLRADPRSAVQGALRELPAAAALPDDLPKGPSRKGLWGLRPRTDEHLPCKGWVRDTKRPAHRSGEQGAVLRERRPRPPR